MLCMMICRYAVQMVQYLGPAPSTHSWAAEGRAAAPQGTPSTPGALQQAWAGALQQGGARTVQQAGGGAMQQGVARAVQVPRSVPQRAVQQAGEELVQLTRLMARLGMPGSQGLVEHELAVLRRAAAGGELGPRTAQAGLAQLLAMGVLPSPRLLASVLGCMLFPKAPPASPLQHQSFEQKDPLPPAPVWAKEVLGELSGVRYPVGTPPASALAHVRSTLSAAAKAGEGGIGGWDGMGEGGGVGWDWAHACEKALWVLHESEAEEESLSDESVDSFIDTYLQLLKEGGT